MNSSTNTDYEELYHLLLDSIPTSVLLLGHDLTILSANKNFLRKSHQIKENVIGKKLKSVFPPIFYEQFEFEEEIRKVMQVNCASPGKKFTYRAPGIPLTIYYYRIIPFGNDRKNNRTILTMDDITEQVRLSQEVERIEMHLASIIDSASDIISTVDKKGTILSWNQAGEKICGITYHELAGKLFTSCFEEGLHWAINRTFQRITASNISVMEEWPMIVDSGESKKISWVCSPLISDSGEPLGTVIVGRDMTEQKKLEQQLVQNQKLTSLGVMAGGIAHQIKNPLAVCSSAAQFLLDVDLPADERVDCAEKIHRNMKKASTIIESLLHFARPGSKGGREITDLTELIGETISLVESQALINQIQIVKDYSRQPLFLNINKELIQQALLNVLLNGIQVMDQKGTLTIVLLTHNKQAKIAITDTGPGIPPEIREKIFDPFFTRVTGDRGGSGLGLSICYSIIELAGGTIEVESEDDTGSTFIISLPLP